MVLCNLFYSYYGFLLYFSVISDKWGYYVQFSVPFCPMLETQLCKMFCSTVVLGNFHFFYFPFILFIDFILKNQKGCYVI